MNSLNENSENIMLIIKNWLKNPKAENIPSVKYKNPDTALRLQLSKKSILQAKKEDKINLVQQYYLDNNITRQNEIRETLKKNVDNKNINNIILLNERFYTELELGVKSEKIKQIIINKRLCMKDVFENIEKHNIKGYIVTSNSDIFFDESLNNIKYARMLDEKKVFTLLRYEYKKEVDLKMCALYGQGVRADSQDTWIWHSNWKLHDKELKLLNIELGIPGCDNKLIYIFNILGFSCYNEPELIKSYHYHITEKRNYDNTKFIPTPYYGVFPLLNNEKEYNQESFDIIRENENLFNYLTNKIKNNEVFILPRIAGIENNIAMFGAMYKQNGATSEQLLNIKRILPIMKNNAGILLTSNESIVKYSELYLSAFHKCDRYFWWEPWGNVGSGISNSLQFVLLNFNKPKIDAVALDVFHSIKRNPWTLALKGKRLLIISPFKESFEKKIKNRKLLYGIDLFPDCEFIFIKPPQTQGQNKSREFDIELNKFIGEINKIKDSFDIALCSSGGYGNLICSALYGMGKSSIYVGGVLQMYFGVYGSRWLRERTDIMRLYLNKHWSRPESNEKPKGHNNVEGNCYW